jgi:hypothetical protein
MTTVTMPKTKFLGGTPQTDSLRDSSVNHALIAIAQEVTEFLRQTYPIQTDEIETRETD